MTELEKKQRAYAITPKLMATEKDKQGRLKEKIEGGIPFELLLNKEEASVIIPLYEFNASFFDTDLSPGAVQLMVFRGFKGTTNNQEFSVKIKEHFFPCIYFKSFAAIMDN